MSANPNDRAGIGCFLTLPEETPTWACPFAVQNTAKSADAALDLSLAVAEVSNNDVSARNKMLGALPRGTVSLGSHPTAANLFAEPVLDSATALLSTLC